MCGREPLKNFTLSHIYHEFLDFSVTCNYELKLEKMNVKEICYFLMSLKVRFKFPEKCINLKSNILWNISFLFQPLKHSLQI